MKIGLVSDIHSHFNALERAVALLKRAEVDGIICAGDVVERGRERDAEKTVSLMLDQQIPCVQGNHDTLVLEHQRQLWETGDHTDPAVRAQLIDERAIRFLLDLPFDLRFEWEGRRVYVTHATPWDQSEHLSLRKPETLRRLVDYAQADVVIVGHTHIPMHMRVGGTHIINPGAVWSELTEDYRTCAVLWLPEFRFQVFDLRTHALMMMSLEME